MAKSRSKRNGVSCAGSCDIEKTPLLIRGDIVSFELANGTSLDIPESWGLVHDPVGSCVDECELFVCPYSLQSNVRVTVPSEVHDAATDYWGSDHKLQPGYVELPTGPWERVGRITRVYYDRYGELSSKYQHPFEDSVKDAAILFKQKRAQRYGRSGSHKAYRISLPNGCIINAHGFVWP